MHHDVTPIPTRSTKTGLEVRAELRRRGQTIRGWAAEHGVDERTVHEVLAGRKRGHWGKAHKVAVLLGLKDGVVE